MRVGPDQHGRTIADQTGQGWVKGWTRDTVTIPSFVMYLLRAGHRTTRHVFLGRAISCSALSLSKSQSGDPYPLPLSSETLASQIPVEQAEQVQELPTRLSRPNESVQTLRARLIYQSRKRGTLENDLLLSTFAAEYIQGMTEDEMREFDNLMDEPDWDIYYWSIGKKTPPERWANSPLLAKLKKHAANEGKAVRRMPDLDTPP